MFRHEGAERTAQHNRLLAAYLASVAGYVNAAGLVLLGVFTSHATGNLARLVIDVAEGKAAASAMALLLVTSYFAGAFFASMVIEANDPSHASRTYGGLLLAEASLFGLFLLASATFSPVTPHAQDALASLLCASMGLQNSLVTRLSGAVVRTTHLTGVLTDLAIEAARWFRFVRGRLSGHMHVRLSFGDRPIQRPDGDKVALLGTLLGSFVVGGLLGADISIRFGDKALLVPIVVITAGGLYGIAGGRGLRLPVARGGSGG